MPKYDLYVVHRRVCFSYEEACEVARQYWVRDGIVVAVERLASKRTKPSN